VRQKIGVSTPSPPRLVPTAIQSYTVAGIIMMIMMMAHLGTLAGLKWHGDGDWRWRNGRAEQCEAPLCEDDGAEGSGTGPPIHTVNAATVAHAPMRRTRSRLVDTTSEPRNNTATLKAVAAALQSASLSPGPLGQRRKREGLQG